MAIHYNQRLDHFLSFSPVMSGIGGLGFICQPKAHHYLLLFFPPSRDQVFRINVRNGDEISKLNQLVNSDNFKVHGSFQSPWVSANFGGNTLAYWRYLSRVFVCNPVLVNMPFLFFFFLFFFCGREGCWERSAIYHSSAVLGDRQPPQRAPSLSLLLTFYFLGIAGDCLLGRPGQIKL